MKRLTEKSEAGYCLSRKIIIGKGAMQIASEITDKLGQLEDIEEELGIDLIVLFKALNSCWFLQIGTKKIFGDIRPTLVYQCGWHLKPNLTELPMIYALKDYGKTWALTKEELL